MYLVKDVRVSQERAEAGFRTEQDRPAAILDARVVSGIGIAEDAAAQGDELFGTGFVFCCHWILARRSHSDDTSSQFCSAPDVISLLR